MVRIQTTAMLGTRREVINVMLRLIKRTNGGMRRWKGSMHSERLAVFGASQMNVPILFIS